jgi:hypothetical protein
VEKLVYSPCVMSTAAYIPITMLGLDTKLVPSVAAVAMKVAHA